MIHFSCAQTAGRSGCLLTEQTSCSLSLYCLPYGLFTFLKISLDTVWMCHEPDLGWQSEQGFSVLFCSS